MAQPFKKQTVRHVTLDGKRCQATTPGAIKRVEISRNYYGTVPSEVDPIIWTKNGPSLATHLPAFLTDNT